MHATAMTLVVRAFIRNNERSIKELSWIALLLLIAKYIIKNTKLLFDSLNERKTSDTISLNHKKRGEK